MTLLFNPFERYFDDAGRPTAQGQQLLASINTLLSTIEGDIAAIGAVNGIPDGGATGQVLAKVTAADYDADWVDVAAPGGSGTFIFDDGDAFGGGTEFTLDDGGA